MTISPPSCRRSCDVLMSSFSVRTAAGVTLLDSFRSLWRKGSGIPAASDPSQMQLSVIFGSLSGHEATAVAEMQLYTHTANVSPLPPLRNGIFLTRLNLYRVRVAA